MAKIPGMAFEAPETLLSAEDAIRMYLNKHNCIFLDRNSYHYFLQSNYRAIQIPKEIRHSVVNTLNSLAVRNWQETLGGKPLAVLFWELVAATNTKIEIRGLSIFES